MRTFVGTRTLGTVALMLMAGAVGAEPISGTTGLNSLGRFQGTVSYAASDSGNATLTFVLTNTSPSGDGYLTAFVFNNPSNRITGASLTSTDLDFGLLGGSSFQDGINGAPFGQFDLGTSTGGSFTGGGNPSVGIVAGATETFTFQLQGTGLDQIDWMSFRTELSVGPGDGQGHVGFAARFRGFDGDEPNSDKVPVDPLVPTSQAPEPATLLLGGVGAACLLGYRLRLRRK